MTATLPKTMHAVEIPTGGPAEVLRWVERPTPEPKAGEVLIRVRAAGVNGHDLGQRRRGSHPIAPGETDLPGLEVSGEVVALGAGAGRLKIGDEVCALMRGGGYAEYATAHETVCLPLPAGFDWVRGAALPEAAFTVWSNVFIDAGLKTGETLLMNGGGGGIGVAAIQIAAALGAVVYASTRGSDKVGKCRALGARRVVDTTTEDFVAVLRAETQGRGLDVIVEVVAGDYINRDLEALAEGGRLVIIGAAKGPKAEIDTSLMSRKRLRMMSSILRPRTIEYKAMLAAELLDKVWPLYGDGTLRPIIDSTFPLEQAARAHARMESGQHFGKVILTVA
jgi:NADPH2:quinone reductase